MLNHGCEFLWQISRKHKAFVALGSCNNAQTEWSIQLICLASLSSWSSSWTLKLLCLDGSSNWFVKVHFQCNSSPKCINFICKLHALQVHSLKFKVYALLVQSTCTFGAEFVKISILVQSALLVQSIFIFQFQSALLVQSTFLMQSASLGLGFFQCIVLFQCKMLFQCKVLLQCKVSFYCKVLNPITHGVSDQ